MSPKGRKISWNIILDPSNALGLSRTIFFVANNGEGAGILDYVPFWGPRASWLEQTGTIYN